MGQGAAGSKIAQEFSGTKYKVCYFVDDDESLQKRSIDGKRVLSREQLKRKILADKFDMLVIALPSVESVAIKQIYKELEKDFSQIKIMPSLDDVLQDESFMNQLKPVSLYDLLARDF